MVKVRVPASTSNLACGFDAIGLALQLFLTVEMAFSEDTLQIESSGEGQEEIPKDERNLVYKSALSVFQAAGKHLPSLTIRINNAIPLSRGLGSSGAAVIAGMVCANQLVGAELSNDDILSTAARLEGHPDNVSASLLGGLTISCVSSAGVVSRRIPLADERLKAVLLIPDLIISTEAARKVLPTTVPHRDAVFNLQRSALLTYAFLTGDYDVLKRAMQDKLHQPYRMPLIPAFEQFKKVALDNGALGVAISGSGSTILALTVDSGANLEAQWQALASQRHVQAKTTTLAISNQGAILVELL
ncbi:MAG: homoserine kinase [bacterium]